MCCCALLLGGQWFAYGVRRASEAGETQGFMEVLVDADTQMLPSAATLGLNGDEVVNGLLDVMPAKQPCTVISRAMHSHPTVSELMPTLLQQLKPLPVLASGVGLSR